MKKVSIIVPVYNVERYLEKCLNSLVRQTLQDIEIIIVNDGSKDASQEIIDKFVERYPDKIISFQKENGGLSDARNYGLDRCNGEFIGFVDSDDYVNETMFEEMYHLAKKYEAEMVICNLQKVNERGEITQKLTQIPNFPEKIILKDNISVFSDLSYFACNKLFKKELFKEKRFKKGVHFEDIQLIPQLLLECKVIAQTQKYHYQYFERSDSISKTHTEKGLDILKAVDEVAQSFEKSIYSYHKEALKNFKILEGVYTFLAYLAFVKEEKLFHEMSYKLRIFMKENSISTYDVLRHKRFNKNYLLSLHFKKQVYYVLYFLKLDKLIKKII